MSIDLIIGPMFSGKTTTLLSYEKKFQVTKKKYLCINHSFDTRYTKEGKLATHDGQVSSGHRLLGPNISRLAKLPEFLT